MTRAVEQTVSKTERVCHDLGLSDAVEAQATGFAERAMAEHPINRSPTAIAAGSVYAAAFLNNEKRTQAEVADAAGSSAHTIRVVYKEILEAEGFDFMDDEPEPDDPEQPTGLFSRLRRFLRGGRAVSPVIGVILMVALTVLLAAAIGTFVLDTSPAEPRPNAAFEADYDTANETVTVVMTQGSVDADESGLHAVGSASGDVCAFEGHVRAGTACEGAYSPGETVRVVWTSASGETSYTLHESEAPA